MTLHTLVAHEYPITLQNVHIGFRETFLKLLLFVCLACVLSML